MAQVENNNIYRVEWHGNHTGWDYRLDIIIPPIEYPLGLPLTNPTIIPLPIGAVIAHKLTIKYPDYFGAPEIPTLDLSINLLEIPNELATALIEPAPTYATTMGNIAAGVVFHLYIKYNNNDTSSNVDYIPAKSFIHYADGRFKYQPQEHTINIQPIDLNFAILRALSFNQLRYDDFTKVTFPIIIECYSLINSAYYSYRHGADGSINPHFKFVKFMDLISWINSKAINIKKLLVRDSNATYDFFVTLPKLYKQTSNVDGSEGSQLSITDLYLLAYITINSEVVGGLFHEGDEQSLQKTYPNSVADFYNELAEFNLRRVYSGVLGVDIDPSYCDTINLDINQIYDVSFSVNEEKIKTVTCSLYERHDDQDTSGDIDKREATIEGSKNEASWTIPVVFNNILTNIKRSGDRAKIGNATMVKNLYYIDKPYGTEDEMIRVHEYAVFELRYYETGNPTSYHYAFKPLVPRNYSNTTVTAMGTQVQSGIPTLLSQFALRCLKGGMDTLECTVEFNNNVLFAEGGAVGNPWLFNNYDDFVFNLTNYDTNNPYLNYLANNWKLVESEIDFISELVKTKFIRLKI